MALLSPRVPHLFPPRTLARLLVTTYAASAGVDDDEAHERLTQALHSPALVEDLHEGLSRALEKKRGPRTSADKLLDGISAGIAKRGGNVRPVPATSAISAVIVRINVEIGVAPEPMRAMLETDRGAATLAEGFTAVGAHLVKELLR